MEQSEEFYYSKGNCLIQQTKRNYVTQVPTDMTEQEQKEYYDTIVKFAKSIQQEGC